MLKLHVTSVRREAAWLTSPIAIQTATSEEKRADLHRCFGPSKAYQERPQACQKNFRSARPRDGGVPGNRFGRKSRIESGGGRIWSFALIGLFRTPSSWIVCPVRSLRVLLILLTPWPNHSILLIPRHWPISCVCSLVPCFLFGRLSMFSWSMP